MTNSAKNAVSVSQTAALVAEKSIAGASVLRARGVVIVSSFQGFRVPASGVTAGVGSDFTQWRDRSGFSPDSFARRLQQHPKRRVQPHGTGRRKRPRNRDGLGAFAIFDYSAVAVAAPAAPA